MGKIKTLFFSICLLCIGLTVSYADSVKERNDFCYSVQAEHPQSAVEVTYQAQEAIILTADELRLKVAETYQSFLHVREATGRNDGAEVKMFLAVTGFKEGNPWCAAFVAYCFTVNDINNPKSAWSPSWFPKHAVIDLNKIKPEQADVFGLYFNNLGRIAHVGFVDRWPRSGDYFFTVEGNTNNAGSREGDGVYEKRRPKRTANKVARYIS
jgi:hypothetical protein